MTNKKFVNILLVEQGKIAAATRQLWQARIEGMILENSHGRDARMVPVLRTLVVRFDHSATVAIPPRSLGVGYARSPDCCSGFGRSWPPEGGTTNTLLAESVRKLAPWHGSVC